MVTCDIIHNEIKNYSQLIPIVVFHWKQWDTFKAVIHGQFISAAATCKNIKENTISELKSKMALLEAKLMQCGSKKNFQKLNFKHNN